MKTYRTFEVARTKGLPFKFAVRTELGGRIQVTRISPYDETEYHWARLEPGSNSWRIFRAGRLVSTIGAVIGGQPDRSAEPFTPEQVAYFLIQADTREGLVPCICHN